MENKLKSLGKKAKETLGNVVDAIDQNDDGKFDLSDISLVAEIMKNNVQEGAQNLKETADEKAKQNELNKMQPVFLTDLEEREFNLPKFIRIVGRDKKFVESTVCQGSVGHVSNPKGTRVVNIFRDSVEAFRLNFYPDNSSELYYVDPSQPDKYIALDEYFNYLKMARVSELQTIAQELGAKHFRVTYRDEAKSSASKNGMFQIKAIANVTHNATSKSYSTTEIEADMTFPGHSPKEPKLRYMKNDPSIQSLISMRMNESTPLLKQNYKLQLSNSSGIKIEEAVKIDAVLKEMKCAPNVTLASEVENEAKRYLEYDIEF